MSEILIWIKSTVEAFNSYPQSLTLDQWFFIVGIFAFIIAIISYAEVHFIVWLFNRNRTHFQSKTEWGNITIFLTTIFLTGIISFIICVCLQTVNKVAPYIESPFLYQTKNFTGLQRINSLISQANHLEMLKKRWSDRKKLGTFIDIKRDFDRYLRQLNKEIVQGKYINYPIMKEANLLFSQTENRPDFQLFKCLVENGVTLKTLRDIRKHKYYQLDTTIFFATYQNMSDNNQKDDSLMGYYQRGYPDSIVVYLDNIPTIQNLRDTYIHELVHSMTSIFISQDNMYLNKIQREGIASYTEMISQQGDNPDWSSGYMYNYLPLFTIIYDSPNLNDAFRLKINNSGWAESFLNRRMSRLDRLIRRQSNGRPLNKNISDACDNPFTKEKKLVEYYREFAKQIPGGENRLNVFLNKFSAWFF